MPVPQSPIARVFSDSAPSAWANPTLPMNLGMDVVEHNPPRLVQAIGSRVWSEDGAEYVDFDNAGGAVLLGHRDPQVIAAVRMSRSADERRGPERYQVEVAERIRAMAPAAEACAFGGEVSQALRAALTAARIVTGREQVFVGRAAGEDGVARRLNGPRFPFDDLEALERLMQLHGEETAAIVLAPCGGREPSSGYLKGVKALCARIGAVLIFDEAVSGFRVHEGGAQALYGVEADLMVYGESLANGMPLGVLAGRRDLVDAVQAAEPLRADIASLAAAKAVLTKIAAEPVIVTLRVAGAEIQAEASARLAMAGLESVVELTGDPAAGRLQFHSPPGVDPQAVRSLWMNECRAHRLFTLGAVNMSYAHGEREIAVLLAAFDQAAERLALALRQAVPQPRLQSPRQLRPPPASGKASSGLMTMTAPNAQQAPYRHGHPKLGLGCSQLGLDQPSSTPRGRPPEREAVDALQIAARAGLKILDAQVQFGRAETLIGNLMPRPNPFRTLIRCVRPDRGPDHVEDELRQALRRLRLDKADTVMVQSAGDLFSPQGPAMWDRLKKLREEGLFQHVGVSVFASDDPVGLTRRFKPDVIQAPVSLLDQRLIVSGALAEIAGLGVEVHLRSIFLQGLLFLPPDHMPAALRGQAGPLSRVRRLIAEGRSDPLQAALWFALSRPEAHHVIVGVASAAELQAVIAAAASAPPDLDWDEMALEHPEALVGGGDGWAA